MAEPCTAASAGGELRRRRDAYWWGLQKAKQHLEELGAPIPALLPFDASQFDPMPEVEIDPPDDPIEADEDDF